MGDVYRVSIVCEHEGDADDETIFEVAGNIGLIVKVAPGALVDALRAANEEVPSGLADRVMDAAARAGAPVVPSSHPFSGDTPKQRKRRTKAEIAADSEAQAAGFRDAAHRAELEVPPAAAAAPVTEEPGPVGSPAGMNVSPVDTSTPAAAAYNPFATS